MNNNILYRLQVRSVIKRYGSSDVTLHYRSVRTTSGRNVRYLDIFVFELTTPMYYRTSTLHQGQGMGG